MAERLKDRETDRPAQGHSVHFTSGAVKSSQGLLDFVDPVGSFEDFAGLGSVSGTDDTVSLHEINEMSGPSVADTQTTLQ